MVVVLAQPCGTSLWFDANSAVDDLRVPWRLTPSDLGWLTDAVQAGFIAGTMVFALTGLADRFPASRIFVAASVTGAAFNAAVALPATGLATALPLRFVVGACLAGIYPLGMKLVVGWAPERASQSLGLLVGMLTLGTALPHGARALGGWPWQAAIVVSSALALIGAIFVALLVALLDDGSRRGVPVARATPHRSVLAAFRVPAFRACVLGYLGHVWELYASGRSCRCSSARSWLPPVPRRAAACRPGRSRPSRSVRPAASPVAAPAGASAAPGSPPSRSRCRASSAWRFRCPARGPCRRAWR